MSHEEEDTCMSYEEDERGLGVFGGVLITAASRKSVRRVEEGTGLV
jgi:RNase P/RNase MRP subunit p30